MRNLYLPLSKNKDELLVASDIYLLAKEYGVEIFFYESGEEISLFDDVSIKPCFENTDTHSSIFAIVESEEKIFTYSDAYEDDLALYAGAESHYFLLGVHGNDVVDSYDTYEIPDSTRVIFASAQRRAHTKIYIEDKAYVIKPQDYQIKLILPLS